MLSQKWILLEGLEKLIGAGKALDTRHREDIVLCPIIRSAGEISGPYGLGMLHDLPNDLMVALSVDLSFFQEADPASVEALATNLVVYFFQVNYLKRENHPVLIFWGRDEGGKSDKLALSVRLRALEQGFSDIVICRDGQIEVDGPPAPGIEYVFGSQLSGDATYFNYEEFVQDWLKYAGDIGNITLPVIFLHCGDPSGAIRVLDLLSTLENDLEATNPLFRIALLLGRINKDLQRKRQLLAITEFDNKNKTDYVAMQKVELLKTLQWYEDQYEVLPLWYKRFGHIIKVFMGKRSFKSLFK